MDTGPIIILANDQKCCYYQSSIQYIARIITTILHHNRDTTGNSVFAAILFHAVTNTGRSVFPGSRSALELGDAAIAYGLITITAIIVVFLWGPKTLARFRYGRKGQPHGLDQMQ